MAVTIEQALGQRTETDAIDFKREIKTLHDGDMCELVKDIVAIGNCGGGAILIGVDSAGTTIGIDESMVKRLDPALIGDKIRKYTGGHEPRCTVHKERRDGQPVLVLLIEATRVPVAFERAGTYEGPKRPMTAFHEGTFYFRHNTKSEPASTEDIEMAIEREVARRRDEWLGNIQKVMTAPPGASLTFAPSSFALASSSAAVPKVALSNSPDATLLAYRSRDETHPHRLKELVVVVNERLPAGTRVTAGDIQNIRRAYAADTNPNWVDRPKHASTQYSDAFIDWLVEQVSRDPRFAAKAKARARREGR